VPIAISRKTVAHKKALDVRNMFFLLQCNGVQMVIWTSTQGVWYSSQFARSIFDIQVVGLKFLNPSRQPFGGIFHCIHVLQGVMISNNGYWETIVNVHSPSIQSLLDSQQLLFVSCVSEFRAM
jgi:hypothetical protein